MERLLITAFLSLFVSNIFAQSGLQAKMDRTVNKVNDAIAKNPDSIGAIADAAVNTFTWDVKEGGKGSMMFLDVPYQRDNSDSVQFLTLTVAKTKGKPRVDFISVIVPNNVVITDGVFIKFLRDVKKNGVRKMEMEEGAPSRALFEHCNSDYCTVRILDGILDNEDIFQKFLDFDEVAFLFIYPDGSHKSVSIPLFSFKQQYKALN